ncbi:MAG: efflux RND transporter permease subunit [Acidobacteria bacterium]|nr:efflux RND transporter permease subunit [Acidobacteriota bacterium]MBK9528125.1 efflux RND transporter permease subunit [Acidobacteriota bacterium]MBP7475706.1 efflux RND transporter permease subunit [Pyrinomonadaceae bacterium]MBP9110180.1 efflux RND transporter permease subunit [Pyrinomonadaceae bacterium]
MQWLAEVCVKRPVFATMLILSLVVVGAFSFLSLGVDLFPKIDFPTITITVVNPGASPEEIETEITEKVEEAVNTISGIDELRSTSIEGISQVFVQFVLEKDVNIAAQEVENRVQTVIPNLPETAEQPTVQKLDTDAAPVLRITVSAPAAIREITELAKKRIKEPIESVNGVGQITIIGGQERQINVWVDPDKMRSYNVTPAEVSGALKIQNMEFPSGRLDEGQKETSVRTVGKIQKVDEFADVVVATRGAYQVKVKDLGYVEDGAEELRSEARLNGQPAVTLIVAKQSGQNTVATARAVKEKLNEIIPTLPKNYQIRIIGDNSIFIENSLAAIEEHLIVGSILAAIVVFLFLWSFRSTFIAGLAIPTSIISTFALMYAMGYTLNSITMLSLTLMVGIVIDDAIVVLENIYRFVEEKGMNPFQAAIEGTREIGLAVLATTLSLMAVFVPIGFMQGIVGRFMSSFGLTASFAVLVSLIVSFTLTPMLAARLIKAKKHDPEKELEEIKGDGMIEQKEAGDSHYTGWFRAVDGIYATMLRFSMAHRWVIVTLCILVFVSIVPLFMVVGKNFLPVDDQSQFEVSVRVPEGSSLTASSQMFERIAAEIRKLPGVTDTLATVGGGQQQVVNAGTIYVKLSDIKDRAKSQEILMADARDMIAAKFPPELRTGVQQVQAFSGGGFRNANVQFMISGPDLKKLEEYSAKIIAKMKTIPDAVDVDSTLISGKPEVRLEVDRATAADLGVRVGDVSQALNTLVAGQEATTFSSGTDQYEVRVRAINPYRTSIEGLKRVIVPSSKLGWVTLDRVVTSSTGTGPSSVDRTNRQRQVTLLANTKPGGSAASITSAIDSYVKELNLPAGYRNGYVGQSKEMGKAGFYFLLAFALSFIFMYIVLAAQFESFIHPVTILLTLPLSIPFGIFSLLVMGQTVNIFSGLGLLLLFGVVKKNAILQIDHTNHLRSQGMSRYDAIIQANRDRLRPILMTTIALVAGMIPLVISSGAGAGTNRSIGVLVVGGQSLCLLLTLLAVPVFYSLFDDLAEMRIFSQVNRFGSWLFGGLKRRVATTATSLFSKN